MWSEPCSILVGHKGMYWGTPIGMCGLENSSLPAHSLSDLNCVFKVDVSSYLRWHEPQCVEGR